MQKPEGTKMVAEPVRTRMVKVKILRDCIKPGTETKTVDGKYVGQPEFLKAGTIVEVDEESARKLLDYKTTGNYSFAGERYDDNSRHIIRKAELTL